MELRTLIIRFVKFGLVGASGMLVHGATLYVAKEWFALNPFVANTIGFVLAATSNYLLNRVWTFRSHERRVGAEYLKFFLVSLVGLGINNGSLWVLTRLLPAWKEDWRFYLLWVVAVGITTLWNFFGNMIFTFKNTK